MKTKIIIIFLFLMTIPFVLVNDFFPFFRFGMFAEPVHKLSGETFAVTFTTHKNRTCFWSFEETGLPTGPEYLLRNYYYRKEGEILLSKIDKIANKKDIKEWKLLKITDKDSTTAAVFQPK